MKKRISNYVSSRPNFKRPQGRDEGQGRANVLHATARQRIRMKFFRDIARSFSFVSGETDGEALEVEASPKVETTLPERQEESAQETVPDEPMELDFSEWRRPFLATPDENTIESRHEDPEHFRVFLKLDNLLFSISDLFRDMELWTKEGRRLFSNDIFEPTPEEREEQGEPTAFDKEMTIQVRSRFPQSDVVGWLNRSSEKRTTKMIREGRTPEVIRQELLESFDNLLRVVLSEIQISWRDWGEFLKAQRMADVRSSQELLGVYSTDATGTKDPKFLIKTVPTTIDRGAILSWLSQWQQSVETFVRESYLWADFVAEGLDRERSLFEERRQEQEVQKILEKYKGRFPVFEAGDYTRALKQLLFNYFKIDENDYEMWRDIEGYKYKKAYGSNWQKVHNRHFLMDMMRHWAENKTGTEKARLYRLIEEERERMERQYGRPTFKDLKILKNEE